MNPLIAQLQRLYFLSDQQGFACLPDESYGSAAVLSPEIVAQGLAGETGVTLNLVDAENRVRTIVARFLRQGDWLRVAELCQVVQAEFDWPAPAISVAGDVGFLVWFSLAEPVSLAQARHFLEGLRCRYLADLPAASIQLLPEGESAAVELVPALHQTSGRWSAFIDPGLGSMFADESGLDMAPSLNNQAQLLASVKSIPAVGFRRALALFEVQDEAAEPAPPAGEPVIPANPLVPQQAGKRLALGSHFSDPLSFLLAVMNDPTASARQRIRAAKALLPYFPGITPK